VTARNAEGFHRQHFLHPGASRAVPAVVVLAAVLLLLLLLVLVARGAVALVRHSVAVAVRGRQQYGDGPAQAP